MQINLGFSVDTQVDEYGIRWKQVNGRYYSLDTGQHVIDAYCTVPIEPSALSITGRETCMYYMRFLHEVQGNACQTSNTATHPFKHENINTNVHLFFDNDSNYHKGSIPFNFTQSDLFDIFLRLVLDAQFVMTETWENGGWKSIQGGIRLYNDTGVGIHMEQVSDGNEWYNVISLSEIRGKQKRNGSGVFSHSTNSFVLTSKSFPDLFNTVIVGMALTEKIKLPHKHLSIEEE